MTKKRILLIGIDPLLLDFSSPEFSAMPGLTAEIIEEGTKASLDEIRALGYEAEKFWVDLGETAADAVAKKLENNHYDAIIVGAGIRMAGSNFLLFEKLINTIHKHAPGTSICFNTSPKDNAAAVKRWV
jgi:hypothetical protein